MDGESDVAASISSGPNIGSHRQVLAGFCNSTLHKLSQLRSKSDNCPAKLETLGFRYIYVAKLFSNVSDKLEKTIVFNDDNRAEMQPIVPAACLRVLVLRR